MVARLTWQLVCSIAVVPILLAVSAPARAAVSAAAPPPPSARPMSPGVAPPLAGVTPVELLRIHIVQPGAYRITGAELRRFRRDLDALDPARLVLKSNGQPYPMLIEGLSAQGRLTDQSRLVFYATLEPPVQYVNVFADNAPLINFFQLFFEGDQREALRFAAPPAGAGARSSPAPQTPPDHAVEELLHFEPNSLWEFFEAQGGARADAQPIPPTDFRFWAKLARPATSEHEPAFSFAFEIEDLARSEDLDTAAPGAAPGARIRARLYGVSNLPSAGDHCARLLVNDREIARATWDGMAPATIEGAIPAGALAPGRNTVTIELIEPAATPNGAVDAPMFDVVMLDWVELNYPRRPRATKDYVTFPAFAAEAARGPRRIAIDGFTTTSLTALDLSNARLAPIATAPATDGSLSVIVDLDGPTSMVVVYGAGTPLGRPHILEPVRLMGLKSLRAPADYVVIAPTAFVAALKPLVDHRRAEGLRVAVAPAEAIYEEFGGGFPTVQSIKDFLALARRQWGAPRYLLLVGDACAVSAIKTWLPTRTFDATGGSHASDSWFAMLDGGDTIPDMAVGRLSASSPEQVAAVVAKTVAREQRSAGLTTRDGADAKPKAENRQSRIPEPSWREETLFIAASSAWARKGANNIMRYRLFPRMGAALLETDAQATRVEQHQQLTGRIVEALNRGCYFTVFFGHGGGTVWEVGPTIREEFFRVHLFDSANVRALTNAERQTILLALTCFTNDFNHPHFAETIGESFLRAQGGAVAVIGASGRIEDVASVRFAKEFFGQVFDREDGREDGRDNGRVGDAMRGALAALNNDELNRYMVLLGDPAARLMLPGRIELTTPTLAQTAIAGIAGRLVGGADFNGVGRLTITDFLGNVLDARAVEIRNGAFSLDAPRPAKADIELAWPLAARVYVADPQTGRDWLDGVAIPAPD